MCQVPSKNFPWINSQQPDEEWLLSPFFGWKMRHRESVYLPEVTQLVGGRART